MRSKGLFGLLLGAALLAGTLVVPRDAAAQWRRPPRGRGGRGGYVAPFFPRALPEFGLRGGYDFDTGSGSLGADLRLPLGPRGRLALAPSGDVFFNGPGHDWQLNLDGELRAPLAGLYGGGGAALIHHQFTDDFERTTKVGWNLFAGLEPRTPLPLRPFVETRWTFHASDYSAFRLAAGLRVPIGAGARAMRRRPPRR